MLLLKLFLLSAILTALLKAQLPILLIKTFQHKAINTSKFLLTIYAEYIGFFVACYKTYVQSYLAVMNSVCCYCELFVGPLSLAIV